jgi:hypothetical protein
MVGGGLDCRCVARDLMVVLLELGAELGVLCQCGCFSHRSE